MPRTVAFEGTYIQIIDRGKSESGKTDVWQVISRDPIAVDLGFVEWRGSWRCYAFQPMARTVFEQKCLREIADFLVSATKAHRERTSDA